MIELDDSPGFQSVRNTYTTLCLHKVYNMFFHNISTILRIYMVLRMTKTKFSTTYPRPNYSLWVIFILIIQAYDSTNFITVVSNIFCYLWFTKIDHVVALTRSFSVFQEMLPNAFNWHNFKIFNRHILVRNLRNHIKSFNWSFIINWSYYMMTCVRNFRIKSYIQWKYFA